MRSQSFFDNEPKQILSAIPDLSAKNKQTVAPSIRGTATTTKQPLLLLLRFQIIQSTLPYHPIGECRLFGFETKNAVVFFIR